MRTHLPTRMLCILTFSVAMQLWARLPAAAPRTGAPPVLMEQMLLERQDDGPLRAAQPDLRADTVWYGDFQVLGGVYYARRSSSKEAVMWTFDRGNGPSGNLPPGVIENGEGWSTRDLTASDALYFRVIDNTLDLGQGVTPPIIAGARSLWVGADMPQALALCWPCGPGYGDNWCQRIVSEPLNYNGAGSVTLQLSYFNDTERCYDGTQIYLLRANSTELMLNPDPGCAGNPAFNGGFTDSIGSYDAPLTYTRAITQAEIGAAQTIHIIIEMRSDIGWSDQDCDYDTIHGPFGTDNVSMTGGGINKSYDFETGLQGWAPAYCTPVGSYVGIEDISCYSILDPCQCSLEGNVMEMHFNPCDDNPTHPIGQHEQVYSPICDDSDNTNLKTILMQFASYTEIPRECGVFLRPGWRYYPWTCEVTGAQGWSPRVGTAAYYYVGSDPLCGTWTFGGTTLELPGTPVPADAQKVIAVIELWSDCSVFSIDPCTCPGGDSSPLFDNFVVGVTGGIQVPAPIIAFATGCWYQDGGSYPQGLFDPRGVVPANIVLNYGSQPGEPARAGDSLVVVGPLPGNDPNKRWESRMWWRVAKRGAFQSDQAGGTDTRYKIWRDRVADGKLIDRPVKPQFTFGWMDSAQIDATSLPNRFVSSFREDDDDYRGEGNAESEMIWDDVLVPGTRIEYFITSNYINTPHGVYYYPDTTGGFFPEFEALPGIRTANVPNCGGAGFSFCGYQPATLYIDMFNRGSQFYVENALRTLLNGLPLCTQEAGCVIPTDRNWDRYDYLDASSNWKVPFGRPGIPGSNAGMTLQQILGYRTILANTGTYSKGTADEDWSMLTQWLVSPDCTANTNRQAFILNGDKTGQILLGTHEAGIAFLTDILQATLFCDSFNGLSQDPDCAPENTSYCVRLLPVAGGPFGTLVDVDAHGSYCPNSYGMNVFSARAGGAGNRIYSAETPPKTMEYAQVVATNLAVGANYKTVLDGVSWHHMTKRNPNPPGGDVMEYCPRDVPSRVEGAYNEIRAALRWSFDVANDADIPKLTNVRNLATCQGTWQILPSDVDDASLVRLNRLFQNEPNPFNARSTISFSVAQTGRVEILVYDVNGRLVRTIVDGPVDVGSHKVVWDGTNDAGHKVGSGVFWTQMRAGSYASNKKMIILR